MIALRSMAKDRRHISQRLVLVGQLIVCKKVVASLPIAPEVEKNKGWEDAMFNISNALSIFPFLGLLMGTKESRMRF